MDERDHLHIAFDPAGPDRDVVMFRRTMLNRPRRVGFRVHQKAQAMIDKAASDQRVADAKRKIDAAIADAILHRSAPVPSGTPLMDAVDEILRRTDFKPISITELAAALPSSGYRTGGFVPPVGATSYHGPPRPRADDRPAPTTGELTLGPVTAWRLWWADDDTLRSPQRGTEWQPGRWLDARCPSHDLRAREPHEAPGARCGCGIYALDDPMDAVVQGRNSVPHYDDDGRRDRLVLGEVELDGRYVNGTRGWRVQRARVYSLVDRPGVDVGALADRYGVPLIDPPDVMDAYAGALLGQLEEEFAHVMGRFVQGFAQVGKAVAAFAARVTVTPAHRVIVDDLSPRERALRARRDPDHRSYRTLDPPHQRHRNT